MDEITNEEGLTPEDAIPGNNNLGAGKTSAEDLAASIASGVSEGIASSVVGTMAEFDEFDEANIKSGGGDEKLAILQDLNLNIYIELGRTKMQIKDILELERGYVIELDKLASEPVDIFVNNKKIAEGEVVVIDKHFGIRIVNLNDPEERLRGVY
ncbi:MAG: flagellar motor switch protein FliN [Bacteroidetes bacterium]|nr:flagellar motor switch protein FliN [Bacteroidota bacterium]